MTIIWANSTFHLISFLNIESLHFHLKYLNLCFPHYWIHNDCANVNVTSSGTSHSEASWLQSNSKRPLFQVENFLTQMEDHFLPGTEKIHFTYTFYLGFKVKVKIPVLFTQHAMRFKPDCNMHFPSHIFNSCRQ